MILIKKNLGFTLIELLVTISIIGILSAIVYANFGSARAAARDDIRQSALKELQLAIEFYKAQNGVYPAQGCGTVAANPTPANATVSTWAASCVTWIMGLQPDYIATLPVDPSFPLTTANTGYYYKTNTAGTEYKLIAAYSVEVKRVTYADELARCPADAGTSFCGTSPEANTYAVYSNGAKDW
jgi:prepilin-type N-terminal cleavage/methylation domain-containing protein